MERKARENLEAARILLGLQEPCTNAAASRAYYAAYLACWTRMNRAGVATPRTRGGAEYFAHARLPDEALAAGALRDSDAAELRVLLSRRIRADHSRNDLTLSDAEHACTLAMGLVERLLGDSL